MWGEDIERSAMSEANKRKSADLRDIFLALQQEMTASLELTGMVISHPGAKGEATELAWTDMLKSYLPMRYCAEKAFVMDCNGELSEEIDVVIYDRQYSPLLFHHEAASYVPAESVYAVFEVRQNLSAENVEYAGAKAASVRRLRRTSAPIPHAGGTHEPRRPNKIISGILTLDSAWSPSFGEAFRRGLEGLSGMHQLDLGCVLRCGAFETVLKKQERIDIHVSSKEVALIFFYLKLLSRLQACGTVPAIDYDEYGRAL